MGALLFLLAVITFLDRVCISVAGPRIQEYLHIGPHQWGCALNTAAQVGSFLSGVAFGYVAEISGSYDLPLILMALVLGFGALIWLKIDPTQELVPEGQTEHSKA